MLQAFLLFVVGSFLFVAVSLARPPPPREQIERYCWRSPLAVLRDQPLTSLLDPCVLALGLVGVMVVCYFVFA